MIYTYNIDSAKGDETIVAGRTGKIITLTSININKPTGAYFVSLILVRGSVESTLWIYNLDEGDIILDTTDYKIDQSSSIKISSTPGISLTVIGVIE